MATETDANGLFTFLDLEPGFYQVTVDAFGFEPSTVQSDVAAGEVGSVMRIQLRPIAGFEAFHNQYQWDGFFQCAAGVQDPVVLGNLAAANLCFIVNFYSGVEVTQDDSHKLWFDAFVDVGRHPDWTQIETAWKSTQTFGDALKIRYQTAQPGTVGAIQCGYGMYESPSPAVFSINRTEAERCGLGAANPAGEAGGEANGLDYEFFPGYNGLPAGVALEQHFSSYVTAFYDYLPPEGWQFTAGDAVPQPA